MFALYGMSSSQVEDSTNIRVLSHLVSFTAGAFNWWMAWLIYCWCQRPHVLCKRLRLSMFVTAYDILKSLPSQSMWWCSTVLKDGEVEFCCLSRECVISVCDVSVHAFVYETLNMSEVFSFLDRDPCLVHLTNVTQSSPLGVGDSTISEVLPMNLVSIQREKSLFPLKIPKSLRRQVSWCFFLDESSFFLWVASRWV